MVGTAVRVATAGVPVGLWAGETCVCIACGPSLTREDVDYCRGKARVLVVNKALLLAPWADAFHAADSRIGKWIANEAREFKGLKFTMERDLDNDYGATLLKNAGIWGLSMDPEAICNGRNSGYGALNVAALLGVSKIVLLGYDAQPGPHGEAHWHADHPNNFNPGMLVYRSWVGAFKSIAKPLADIGVAVVNATRVSALDCFQRGVIHEVLE